MDSIKLFDLLENLAQGNLPLSDATHQITKLSDEAMLEYHQSELRKDNLLTLDQCFNYAEFYHWYQNLPDDEKESKSHKELFENFKNL